MLGYAGTYAPRSTGMVFFLMLSVLLLSPRRTVAETIIVVLIFAALALSHGFTCMVVIPALVLLSIYRRDGRFVALFIVLFGTWYLYQAFAAMEVGVHQWWNVPFFDIFLLTEAERYQLASVTARAVNRYALLSYLVLYLSLFVASAFLFFRGKINVEHKKYVIALLCWAVGVGLMTVMKYGGEGPYRLYLFCLLPLAAIIVLSFYGRKLLAALIPLCAVIFLFANYSGDSGYQQVQTSELRGAEFMAVEVAAEVYGGGWYYGSDPGLFLHYNPELSGEVFNPTWHGPKLPEDVDLSSIHRFRHIIISRKATDGIVYNWGEDPYALWPQTEVGKRADLLYNNGYFQLYDNNLYMEYRK